MKYKTAEECLVKVGPTPAPGTVLGWKTVGWGSADGPTPASEVIQFNLERSIGIITLVVERG